MNEAGKIDMSQLQYASKVWNHMLAMVCSRPDTAQTMGIHHKSGKRSLGNLGVDTSLVEVYFRHFYLLFVEANFARDEYIRR